MTVQCTCLLNHKTIPLEIDDVIQNTHICVSRSGVQHQEEINSEFDPPATYSGTDELAPLILWSQIMCLSFGSCSWIKKKDN